MSRLDDIEKRLNERLVAIDRKIGKAVERGGCDAPREPVDSHELNARAAVVGAGRVFVDYVQPSATEASQLFEYVRRSPVVQDNALYAQTMNSARFEYHATPEYKDQDRVNANAGLDKGGTPVIRLFGGAARIGRIAALSIAAMERGGDADAPQRFLKTLTRPQCGYFTVADAVQVVNDAGLAVAFSDDSVLTKAKTISAGLMLGILAHEAGHLCLGHSFSNVVYYETNLEVARNREREADSFSSSVIATSPFGEQILAGTLLWHFVLASQEEGAVESTHPLSRERLENIVRANRDLAKSLGIELAGA